MDSAVDGGSARADLVVHPVRFRRNSGPAPEGPCPRPRTTRSRAAVLAVVTFVLVLGTLIRPARLHLAYSLHDHAGGARHHGLFRVRPGSGSQALRDCELHVRQFAVCDAIGRGRRILRGGDRQGGRAQHRALGAALRRRRRAGREIFRVECQSCHTADAYRGVRRLLAARQWDSAALNAMLGSLDMMHNGVMPPFAGTDAERDALSAYLATLYQARAPPSDGQHLFEQNCAVCHQPGPTDPAITTIRSLDPADGFRKPQEPAGAVRPDAGLEAQRPAAHGPGSVDQSAVRRGGTPRNTRR